MGGVPTCSLDDPSACVCDIDASAYAQTPNFAYCAEPSHSQNSCCATIGDNFGSMGYTFEYYNCVGPNPAAVNTTLCPNPATWKSYEPLKCGPVYDFYMDLTNERGTDLTYDPYNPDTFCCGIYNITCDQENYVTGM